MAARVHELRRVLGQKLRELRQARGQSLKQVAAKAGVSVSYLSEIEQGKKYPKPEKIAELAAALGTHYDALVRVEATVGSADGPFADLLNGREVRGAGAWAAALRTNGDGVGALVAALVEEARRHGLRPPDVLAAAAEVFMHRHPETLDALEREAEALRAHADLPDAPDALEPRLRRHLAEHYGYRFDDTTLAAHPVLHDRRSVAVRTDAPMLYLNARLRPPQRAFLLAREVAVCRLGLAHAAASAPADAAPTFDAALDTRCAAHFASALVLPAERMRGAIESLFGLPRWHAAAFLGSIRAFGTTPETYLRRLSVLLPRLYGLDDVFVLRYVRPSADGDPALTGVFDRSALPLGHALNGREHVCQRALGPALLRDVVRDDVVARAQRTSVPGHEAEYLTLAVAHPRALGRSGAEAVVLGLRLDGRLGGLVRFAGDPALPRGTMGVTCERCPLPEEACAVRAAPPVLLDEAARRERRQQALVGLGAR